MPRWHRLVSQLGAVAAAAGCTSCVIAAPEKGTASHAAQADDLLPSNKSWTAGADDALLFDVRLAQYHLGEGVRGYNTPSGICVDFGDIVATLDLPIRIDKKSRRATGWIFEEEHSIVIDRDANTVQIANKKTELDARTIQDTPEGWCVQVAALQSWFGIKIKADLNNALLLLTSDTKLPLQNALERKQKAQFIRPQVTFDLKTLPQARVISHGIMPPAIDVIANLGSIHDHRTGNKLRSSYELYAGGEVGNTSYDARLASDIHGQPQMLRARAYRTDPNGNLLGRLHATHYEVGDVTGITTPLVAQTSLGRGVMITNQPVERASAFGRTSFTGELPQGWDAELYRNNQLLAFMSSRPDGRYEFTDVALLYGQNHFEIVLYGPQGQIRRERHDLMVGGAAVPAKKTYYWAGLDQDGYDLLNLGTPSGVIPGGWRGSFGIEHGIDRKTSVSLMFHTLTLSPLDIMAGARRTYQEAAIDHAFGPALFELSEAASLPDGGLAIRGQLLAQFGTTYVSAESINAFHGYQSDRVLRDVTGVHTFGLDHTLKIGPTYLPFHVDTKLTTLRDGTDTIDTSARLSANLGRWLMTGGLELVKTISPNGPDTNQLQADWLANIHVGRVHVYGETRVELVPSVKLTTASLIAEWTAGHNLVHPSEWRAELGYDQTLSRAHASLGYIKQFHQVAVTATGEVASDGSVAAGLNVAFSLGRSRHGGVRIVADKLASRGSILVRVYRDLNHNGVHDPGEPYEKGVLITAGHVPVTDATNAQGEVIIDGLQPFLPLLIGIDGTTLADPLVQPEGVGLVVIPRPGVLQEIELAVASTGEVDGTLLHAGGGPVESADVNLVDAAGHIAAHAKSEYDGYLLFENVPYGQYALRLATTTAETLKAEAILQKQIIVGDKTPNVHLGNIIVQNSDARPILKAASSAH